MLGNQAYHENVFKTCFCPFQIAAKISELNYELLGKNDRKIVVRINRLKLANGGNVTYSKPSSLYKRRTRKR